MYATLESMTAQFGERELIAVTDTDAPYTMAINMAKLNLAMAAANSEIDGYLLSRYPTGIQNPPMFLVKVACDIARYHVVTGNGRVTERDTVRYEQAVKTLSNISKGVIALGPPPTGGEPTPTLKNEVVMVPVRENVFGKGGW
jgi:phage gp36-like protein